MPAHATRIKVDDGVTLRQCTGPRCRGEVWKPWTEEFFHHLGEGLQYWCRECMCHRVIELHAKNPEAHRARSRRWRRTQHDTRSFRLARSRRVAETESNPGVALEKITANWQRRRLFKGETMKELREMIRSMRGVRPSAELSIPDRAEHIVALGAKLHAAEAEAAAVAAEVERIHGEYLNNEQGPTVAQVDKAQAIAERKAAVARGMRQEIARLKREQAEAQAAERQAAYEARLVRITSAHADVVNAAEVAHELVVDLAAAFNRILAAEASLVRELDSDERRDLPRPAAAGVLALTLWAQTFGEFPPHRMQAASSPFVTGQALTPLPDLWRGLGDRIRGVVHPPVPRESDNQPTQEAAA